jgi:hypothetical protein
MAQDLTWADMPNQDLRSEDLHRLQAKRANLAGCNLSRKDLVQANLSGANLAGADLSHANLTLATLSDVDFRGANLFGADLAKTKMDNAHFDGADLRHTNWVQAGFGTRRFHRVRVEHAIAFLHTETVYVSGRGSLRVVAYREYVVNGDIHRFAVTDDSLYFHAVDDFAWQPTTVEFLTSTFKHALAEPEE